MKPIIIPLIAMVLCSCTIKDNDEKTKQQVVEETPEKLLRHVVLFKFKDDVSEESIQSVEAAFADLPRHIPEIKGFEWGINNSPEGINQGFTHCFFLSFADEASRAVYLPHPKHKAFGELLDPFLDKVLVVDYWVNE